MLLTEMFDELATLGLSLRRKGANVIEVVGDVTVLTPELKTALGGHKEELLQLIPEPKPRPAWWSDGINDAENQAIDEFMGYDADGEIPDESVAILDVAPCDRCDSLILWWDWQGDVHCRTCEPPRRSVALAAKAVRLRKRADEREADPKVPKCGRYRPYRGRKHRAKFV